MMHSTGPRFNPFPGLRSFDVWENHLFFGRDEQIDALLRKLTQRRFVSVVGTSGSGKSSLVRAGLLPVLYGGFMVDAGSSWQVAVVRPGSSPIYNLARGLNGADVFGTGDEQQDEINTAITAATLEGSSMGLIQVVRQAHREEGENLLLVVDQFEELFRFKENSTIIGAANEAAAFVKLLLEAVRQSELPIYVVLTLRSDFLGDCAQFRDLPESINEGQYLIPRLRREQLREAIIGPVAVGGGKIAPRLVQQLLNDVGDNPDQLPILQHALMRTWDRWTEDTEVGEPIDIRHYEAIGGMAKALSRHADEAYNELTEPESALVCETLFKCLTERGPDNRGIRRPTRMRDVCVIADAKPEEVIAVVDRFRRPGRSFIMPPHGVPLAPDTMLDISHESLMRVWERLQQWVNDDAESAAMYKRLVQSSALHERDQAGLWRDPELQEAVNWRTENRPNAHWAQRYDPHFERSMLFLEASIRQRDIELREKRHRRVIANMLIASFLVCAIVLTGWALNERSGARANAISAIQQERIAEEERKNAKEQEWKAEHIAELAKKDRDEAQTEKSEADKQKKIAEIKSSEAVSQKQRAETMRAEAESASNVATNEKRKALQQKNIADSLKTLAEQSAGNVAKLRVAAVAKALAVKSVQLQHAGNDELGALLALQAYAFNASSGGVQTESDVFDALHNAERNISGDEIKHFHHGSVRAVVYARDGSMMLSSGSEGTIAAWDNAGEAKQPSVIATGLGLVKSLSINPDNIHAAAVSGNQIALLNVRGHDAPVMLESNAPTLAVAYSSDGKSLIALGTDHTLRALNPLSGQIEKTFSATHAVQSFGVGPSGMIAAGGEDGAIILWRNENAEPVSFGSGHATIFSVAFSADGKFLATADANGAVRVFAVSETTAPPLQFTGRRIVVRALAFSPDGTMLASGGSDGRVQLWNMKRPNDPPMVIADNEGWIWSVAFRPDGKSIAIGGADHTVRFVSVHPEYIADAITKKMRRNLSKKEWRQYVGEDIPYEKTCPQLSEGTD